ncbi:MAG TPA: tetratricopeptide repeat protein [bacterium]|nr:tetratricopeptide repeat protein [bacterium]
MKILCPACSRQYTIDDKNIPEKGLLVKCSVCSAEFRAKKDPLGTAAEPASTPKPEPVPPAGDTQGGDSLDDLFNDLTVKPTAGTIPETTSSPEGSPSLDLDSLRRKYSQITSDREETGTGSTDPRKEKPIERTGSATIPTETIDNAVDSLIERNEDYASASPQIPDSTSARTAPKEASAAPQKDLIDSLFDDMGDGPDIDQEKTRNFARADLSAPELKAAPAAKRPQPEPQEPRPATRIEKRPEGKQARAPEGLTADRNDAMHDLFSDMSADDLEKRIIEKSVIMGSEELAELGADDSPGEPSRKEIYLRKRQTNETLGPFPEKELAAMISRKEVGKNDFISYDGIRWEPLRDIGGDIIGQTITASGAQDPGQLDLGGGAKGSGIKLSLSDHGGAGKGKTSPAAASSSASDLFNDSVATFDDDLLKKRDAVEHTVIPETIGGLADITAPGATEPRPTRRKKKKKSGRALFALKIAIVLMVILSAAGSTAWWYKNRKPKADILEKISETIAESTGTLSDVRESLNRDTRQDYLKSLGILKQYMRSEEVPPAVAGLDAQVKVNLFLSYGKKTEPLETIADRIEAMRTKNPDDPDLIKAIAITLLAMGDPGRATEIVQPYSDKNDPDIMFTLGMAAKARKDIKNAETFFNAGYIASGAKNNKLAFALAELKIAQGDIDGSLAFLNKIISASPYYTKAYLKKAEALAYEKKNIDEAIQFLVALDATVLSQADDTEKARYYAMLGDLNYRKGMIADAIENYKRVISIEKENVKYLSDLAAIYQETNQSALALEHYEKALAVENRYVPAVIGKAEIFVRLKKYNEAFLEIAKIDIDNLQEPRQILRLGNLFHQQNEREKALQLYERSIKIDPALVDGYLGRIFVYLEMNMYDEIRKIVENLGELNKESHSYYLIKGILYHVDGEYKKAEEAFQRSLELNRQDDPRVHYYYGRFLYDRESFAKAAENFAFAVKQSPDDPEYRVSLAEALGKEKRYKEMLAVLEPVEGNQRTHAKAFQLRAEALLRTGDLDGALKEIEKSIRLDAKNSYFFYKKGEILYNRTDLNAAIVAVETALLLDIKSFDSYILFAKILLKKGDFKTAVEKLEEAERIDATNQQVFLLKGILYKNLDNYPDALRNFRKIKKNPDLEKEALLEIGECYLNLEKIEEALKYLIKAVQAGNKTGYRFLARIYYDRGNLDKAATYYRQTLSAFPDDPEPIKQLAYIFKERQKYAKARSYFKRYIKHLKPGDPERQMIEDEIYYSEKNIGGVKLTKIRKEEAEEERVETLEKEGDPFNEEVSAADVEEAKTLYMEAVSLVESDRKGAEKLLKRAMKLAPETNRYYIKARKLLKKMKEEEEDI